MVNSRIIVGDYVIFNKNWLYEDGSLPNSLLFKAIWKVLEKPEPDFFTILSLCHQIKPQITIILPEYCLLRLNKAKTEEFLKIMYDF